MKPDWSDAPEWANYLVQDHEGDFIWFESKPDTDLGVWSADGRSLEVRKVCTDWEDTLEVRP